ncbi:MAG TPA: SRPBCC family protein [Pseudonocardiaceae bacterium]|jgi:uncharacterized protein YndB with AHSA1/START domain|nr:SRPBCC family protein [Pseudonocardiaceae bacterium]
MATDRIERDILIAAPIERVWAVLTEPKHVGTWFGQGKPIPVDLRPGGTMELDHGEHGVFPTTIVRVDPPRHLAYRWASGYPGEQATEDNATLVEFDLSEEGAGTRLRLVESGFTDKTAPAHAPDSSLESHTSGWTAMLPRARDYAESLPK